MRVANWSAEGFFERQIPPKDPQKIADTHIQSIPLQILAMFIGKQAITLLVALGLGIDAYAGRVSYAEGYFKIPDETTELSAAEVKQTYPKYNQARAFEKRDSNHRLLISILSFVSPPDPSNCGSFQELRAAANVPEEQKSNLLRGSHPSIDLNAQQITCVVTTQVIRYA